MADGLIAIPQAHFLSLATNADNTFSGRVTLLRLPPELLSEVFEHLGLHDLTVVARTSRALLTHAAAVLWRYPPPHAHVDCPAPSEHRLEIYRSAVRCLTVCGSVEVLDAERDAWKRKRKPLPPPDPIPRPAVPDFDPLARWGVFPRVRELNYILADAPNQRWRNVARRRCRVRELQRGLGHCGATLTTVRLFSSLLPTQHCRFEGGPLAAEETAGANAADASAQLAAAVDGLCCAECVDAGEDMMSLFLRHCPGLHTLWTCGNLSIVGMARAVAAAASASASNAAAPPPLSKLRQLDMASAPSDVPLLVSLVKDTVMLLELRIPDYRHDGQHATPAAAPSSLVALEQMVHLQDLNVELVGVCARLTSGDVRALDQLPLGLRSLTLGGGHLDAPDMTDADVAALVSRLPSIARLRLRFKAPRLTPNLLTALGAACRRLEILQLPLSFDALERWQAGGRTIPGSVLFPRLAEVHFDMRDVLTTAT